MLPASTAIPAVLMLVGKANALQSGWGHTIFQSANEMHHNRILREKLNAIQIQMFSDRDWWHQEKASIQSEFMKELEDGEKETAKSGPSSGVEKLGSDEDTVLVESGGPAASGAVSASKGGTPKKRKGKK